MMIVDCFHGSIASNTKSILENNFRESTRKGLWLGHGRYFFQDAPELAALWAKDEVKRKKITEDIVVFKTKVDLDSCIDLVDIKYWPIINTVYNDLIKLGLPAEIKQLGFEHSLVDDPNRFVGNNKLDCYIMNAARQAILDIYQVRGIEKFSFRAAFAEGRPVYPSSWLFNRSNLMLCVFNPSAFVSDPEVYNP